MSVITRSGTKWYLMAALLLTLIALSPTLFNGFLNWDDTGYITENFLIRDFTYDGFVTIINTLSVVGLYHPLTIMSLSFDFAIAGLDPLQYHLTNIVLHLINVALVYVFSRFVGLDQKKSLLVSILFGVHPMHVESVAWISARKDLLYVLFLLAGLISYEQYYRKSTRSVQFAWYGVAIFCMLLSVLSKATAVVFPVILFGLDYVMRRPISIKSVTAKVPFLLLSLVFGLIAIKAQDAVGAFHAGVEGTFVNRVMSVGYDLMLSTVKVLAPFELSPFHPYTFDMTGVLPWYVYTSWIVIGVGLWLVFRSTDRIVKFGALIYFAGISLSLQVVSRGLAFSADRYTYFAYVGLFIILVQVVSGQRLKNVERIVPPIAITLIVVYAIMSFNYSKIWKSGETLWSKVIEVYPDDYFAYYNRADYYLSVGQLDLAKDDFLTSIRLKPEYSDSYNRLGVLYQKEGSRDKAKAAFIESISRYGSNERAWLNLGRNYFATGDVDSSALCIDRAIEIDSDYALAHLNRGVLFEQGQELDSAIASYTRAIGIEPLNPVFYRYRSITYYAQGSLNRALDDMSRTIQLDPGHSEARYLRSVIRRDLGDLEGALRDAEEAFESGYAIPEGYIQELRNLR